MIKIYLDVHKENGIKYVEDFFSSSDIVNMPIDDFTTMIKTFGKEIHSCYPSFINHMGRFHREFGNDWLGEMYEIYANKCANGNGNIQQYFFDKEGQLIDWPYNYFY